MDDRYHVCRWCRHYSNEKCLKDNVDVVVRVDNKYIDPDDVEIYIKDQTTFYCKEWQ